MAGLGAATITVLANTAGFEQSLKRSFALMSRRFATISAVALAVGGATFLAGAIKNTIELERRIGLIKALVESPVDQKLFDAKHIRALSDELGAAANDVADALQLTVSSGIDAKNAAEVVTQSWKLATATGSDLTDQVRFVTAAVNGFGKDGITAAKASDILFQTFKDGVGSAKSVTSAFAAVMPAATNLGVKLQEVGTLIAEGTLGGKSPEATATGIKVAMQELSSQTTGAGKVFKETFGTSFAKYMTKGHTFVEGLRKIVKKFGQENLTDIFHAKGSSAAIKNLIGLSAKLPNVINDINSAAGTTQKAYDVMENTTSRNLQHLKTKWKNFQGSIGDSLHGAIAHTVDFLSKTMDGLSALPTKLKGPWDSFKKSFGSVWDSIIAKWTPVLKAVKKLLGDFKQPLIDLKNAVGDTLTKLWDFWTVLNDIWQLFIGGAVLGLVKFLDVIGPPMITALTKVVGWVGDFAEFLSKSKDATTALATGITVALIPALSALVASAAVSTIAAIISGFETIALYAMYAGDAIVAAIGAPIAIIVALATAVTYLYMKFQTAREIITGAMGLIVEVIGQAAKDIIWVFQQLLEAWSHVPKILGGGTASKDRVQALQEVKDGIDSLIQKIYDIPDHHDTHLNMIVSTISADNFSSTRDASGFRGVNARAAELAAGQGGLNEMSKQQMEDFNARELKKVQDAASASLKSSIPDWSGGSYNPDTKKDAKKAADEAAAAIKVALKKVLTDLNRIAKNTGKQTIDTIKSNFQSLYDDLKAGARTDLFPAVKKVEKQLTDLGNQRDKLGAKYKGKWKSFEDLKDILSDLKQQSADFVKGIKAQVRELGNVADASKGIGTTYTGIRNQLRGAIAMTKQFTAYVNKLRKLNLNNTSLRQIIEAGPEAGMQSAKALVQAGKTGVTEINKLQTQLDAAGSTLATSANDQFYKSGINAAQGLVDGLQKQHDHIVAVMDSIADKFVLSIVTKLGMKATPSQIAAAKVPVGGVKKKVTTSHTSSIVVHQPVKVEVHGVSDPNAAKKAGVMAGEGVQKVLERQRVAVVQPVI